MRQKVMILTYGGTGREINEIANDQYEVIGFLDDIKQGCYILGTIAEVNNIRPEIKLISGLGSYRSMARRKKILCGINLEKFVNLIATGSKIYSGLEMGQGVIVFPNTVISVDVKLGDHSFIYHNCVIAHDVSIGNFSMISNSVCISGGAEIGQSTYIGAGATILDGRKVGDNCVVAAGAIVVKDVPDNKIYISKDEIKQNKYLGADFG